jgi:non-ribosomal peptide synthetase component F
MTATTVASPRVWTGEPLGRHDPVPLPGFLLEHARALGDKPAMVDGPTGRTLSYRQLAVLPYSSGTTGLPKGSS